MNATKLVIGASLLIVAIGMPTVSASDDYSVIQCAEDFTNSPLTEKTGCDLAGAPTDHLEDGEVVGETIECVLRAPDGVAEIEDECLDV